MGCRTVWGEHSGHILNKQPLCIANLLESGLMAQPGAPSQGDFHSPVVNSVSRQRWICSSSSSAGLTQAPALPSQCSHPPTGRSAQGISSAPRFPGAALQVCTFPFHISLLAPACSAKVPLPTTEERAISKWINHAPQRMTSSLTSE